MTVTVNAAKTATVVLTDPTPINGGSVNVITPTTLNPADAFALGDALKDAARKAGFTPTP